MNKNNIQSNLNQITDHLSQNAIKRIFTFNDNCIRILREGENNTNCEANKYNLDYEVRIENKPPELDPTYTQQYIYSNFLKSFFNIKVIADNWIKFADTMIFMEIKMKSLLLDVSSKFDNKLDKKKNFYNIYKEILF